MKVVNVSSKKEGESAIRPPSRLHSRNYGVLKNVDVVIRGTI